MREYDVELELVIEAQRDGDCRECGAEYTFTPEQIAIARGVYPHTDLGEMPECGVGQIANTPTVVKNNSGELTVMCRSCVLKLHTQRDAGRRGASRERAESQLTAPDFSGAKKPKVLGGLREHAEGEHRGPIQFGHADAKELYAFITAALSRIAELEAENAFLCTADDLHPYACYGPDGDGTGAPCAHCLKKKIKGHDPDECALCHFADEAWLKEHGVI
jgi:hypothetical protein